MKKTLLSLVAVAALAGAAAPAAAQGYGYGYGYGNGGPGYGYDHGGPAYGGGGQGIVRGDNLEARIARGVRSGQLSYREAASLRAELRQAERLAWRYRSDGRVTRWEQADLDRRFDSISARLRYERHDREYGYGYGPRH
ncbi:hypothetical protein [Phenylobacterium conjunctum]|uniref:Uncharacterized protein n=1 Tax=Phenylobacterium conjunctum TaxID=1298959 RepID=A0ABW3T5T5_9CAUL